MLPNIVKSKLILFINLKLFLIQHSFYFKIIFNFKSFSFENNLNLKIIFIRKD